jgi:hypothetical protein
MKIYFRALLMFVFLVNASAAFAQLRKVPAEVTEALKVKYPDARNVSWQDKISDFVASFDLGSDRYQTRFTSHGDWESSEKTLRTGELPASIKDGLQKSKYADWPIKSAYERLLSGDKKEFRILAAKTDIQKKKLFFAEDGQLIKDNLAL